MRQSRTVTPLRGDVHARGVAAQVAAAPAVDVEALDRHVVGAHAHDAARARARQARAVPRRPAQGLVDEEVADVGAGGHLEAAPGRGGVDPRLQGRDASRGAGRPSSAPGADRCSCWARGASRANRPRRTRERRGRQRGHHRGARVVHVAPGLPPGDARGPRSPAASTAPMRVGGQGRVGVDLEVRQLLEAEHRRHERLDPHRRPSGRGCGRTSRCL